MALKQALQILALMPVQTASSNEAIPITGDYTVPAGLVAGDIIEMAPLPAGYVPVDVTVVAQDMDSTAAMTMDVGIVSGAFGEKLDSRTMGAEFLLASTIGQAGGVARANVVAGFMVAPTDADRGIGVKLPVLGTPIVGSRLRLIAWVRPAVNGV